MNKFEFLKLKSLMTLIFTTSCDSVEADNTENGNS